MKRKSSVSMIVAAALVAAGPAWAQEAYRGSLPDGVGDESVEVPRSLPAPIELPSYDPEDQRAVLPDDRALLERGFGTVSRSDDGEITEEAPSDELLDALRGKRTETPRDVAPVAPGVDPLFASNEGARAIVGSDDRIRVQDNRSYPFRAFGLLIVGEGRCSATLIGPRSVLTAAHCVYDYKKGWVSKIKFYPGANGSGNFPYKGYAYRKASILSGYISNWTGNTYSSAPWDMAIITLHEPAGDHVGWLGFRANYGTDFTAYNVGYPGDKPYATMWRTQCDFRAEWIQRESDIKHECDIKPGSSGSSMYRYNQSDNSRYVEAVVTAESERGNPETNTNWGVVITAAHYQWLHDKKWNNGE